MIEKLTLQPEEKIQLLDDVIEEVTGNLQRPEGLRAENRQELTRTRDQLQAERDAVLTAGRALAIHSRRHRRIWSE